MLSTPIRIALAIAMGLALLASHGFMYQAGQDSILSQWHQVKAADAMAQADSEARARDRERQISKQIRTAEDRHVQEVSRRSADASGARLELERLRTQIAAGIAVPACTASQASTSAARVDAPAAYSELFEQCSVALSDVATEADRLAGQVTGLQSYIQATQEPAP